MNTSAPTTVRPDDEVSQHVREARRRTRLRHRAGEQLHDRLRGIVEARAEHEPREPDTEREEWNEREQHAPRDSAREEERVVVIELLPEHAQAIAQIAHRVGRRRLRAHGHPL
jgi:hypothetical protein